MSYESDESMYDRSLVVDGCTFDAQQGAPPLRTIAVDSVTLRNSTFTGTGSTYVSCNTGNLPDYAAQGEYMGGGAHIQDAAKVLVEDCAFKDLQSQSGGGLSIEYGTSDATVVVRRTSFTNDTAEMAGGGLHVQGPGTSADLEDLTFDRDTACYGGGALAVEGFGAVTLARSTFDHYHGYTDAGGAHLVRNDKVDLDDVSFLGSDGLQTPIAGGALLVQYGNSAQEMTEVTLNKVKVHATQSLTTGGGAQVTDADTVNVADSDFETDACAQTSSGWCLGAGLYVARTGDLTVDRSAFVANSASGIGQVGAGLEGDQVHALLVRDSIFSNNVVAHDDVAIAGNRGGGIDFRPQVYGSRTDPTSITVDGSTFIDNHATQASGISIDRVFLGDVPDISTSVVGTVIRDSQGAEVIAEWTSSGFGQAPSGVIMGYSDIQGHGTGDHMIDVDPLLQPPDTTGADPWQQYRPSSTSPLIGAGFYLTDSVDFEGTARANPPTIGAFEAQ